MIPCRKGAEFYSLGRRALDSKKTQKTALNEPHSLKLPDIVNSDPTEPIRFFIKLGLGTLGYRIMCRWHLLRVSQFSAGSLSIQIKINMRGFLKFSTSYRMINSVMYGTRKNMITSIL
jgi:hypothetical protein